MSIPNDESDKIGRNPTNHDIKRYVRETVTPKVKQALQESPNADCPHSCLCHNVDQKRIAQLIQPFSDLSDNWRYSVYVLECKLRSVSQKVVREELELQQKSRWVEKAQSYSRLVYVGVAKRVNERLMQHASARGKGANFTQTFPAMRVLSVDYYPRRSIAYDAEVITADILERQTNEEVYISQPG